MSSSHTDAEGNATCVVCRKKKKAAQLSICQGCMKFTCDPGCGSFVHKLGGWYCKNCQEKAKK